MRTVARCWMALVLLALGQSGLAEVRPITHEDMWLMPRVGTPVLSPDGSRAIVSVSRPAYDNGDQAQHLWLVSTDGGVPPRQVTFASGGESQVTWSPDGRRIAFIARRDGDEAGQVYLLDLHAGGEARRVTAMASGARQPRFSPDGQRIAFTSNVDPALVLDPTADGQADPADEPRHHVLAYEGFPIRNWNVWLDQTRPSLFVQSLEDAEAGDLLARTELFALPGFDGRRTAGGAELDVAWTPDSESLVFVASRNRDRFAFDYTHNDLWQVGLDGGEPRRLTGQDGPEGDDSWSNPVFSPDGKSLLVQRTPRSEHVYNATRLALFDWPQARMRAEITLPELNSVLEFAVDPAGRQVYLLGEDAGLVRLYRAPIEGGQAQALFERDRGIYAGLAVAGDAEQPVVVARFESAAEPAEIVRFELDGTGHVALTEFTAEAVAGLDLAPPEHFWFDNDDGVPIHSMLVRPAGFDPERQYPLLVLMHGGPHIMYRDYFFLRWNYHLLAGTDYVLVLTNYSGSTGFGENFARRIQGDPLRGPANEINQAADVAIERFGFIDGERQCAGGASYGGHLANWMQASTDRYRCLISHAGLVNLKTQWGTSDAIFHREAGMGGPFWELPEVWAEQNPIRFAANFSTPALVTIGKKDERVPLANVLEYWAVLQRQQVQSRLLVYPDEDHWIMNGHNSRHFYGEIERWLARWLLED